MNWTWWSIEVCNYRMCSVSATLHTLPFIRLILPGVIWCYRWYQSTPGLWPSKFSRVPCQQINFYTSTSELVFLILFFCWLVINGLNSDDVIDRRAHTIKRFALLCRSGRINWKNFKWKYLCWKCKNNISLCEFRCLRIHCSKQISACIQSNYFFELI